MTLYQLRSLRTSHLPSGNLKSSDTEDSKYHLSGDQINCSSDWSHLQQTFHLSSNPLRMHNSSLSSASSSTDTWDFDPDLIIPDDSEKDTEDSTVSSSIESALISSNAALANQLSHLVNRIGKGGQEKGGAGSAPRLIKLLTGKGKEPEIYSESNEERTAEVRSLLGGVICGQKISMRKHELIDLNRLEMMGA
ncbi:hypothetical protein PPACK8108_LOCUS15220 [Phakopsora pachyrhizi]|uniref:Uncharacterized protein n=1 Tax=Phakopsora pachyrhizi TaxID=170000 RepID=A0AAV0B8D3_PHAPC|nr:hypothetical protein PPACK8108_LOCUS15220 [Phakopsora pachyrhizi]